MGLGCALPVAFTHIYTETGQLAGATVSNQCFYTLQGTVVCCCKVFYEHARRNLVKKIKFSKESSLSSF